jgi:septal ring factor EnvC (AmiA/AmiB activator)
MGRGVGMITDDEYRMLVNALKQATDALEEVAEVINNQGEELADQRQEIELLKMKVNQ